MASRHPCAESTGLEASVGIVTLVDLDERELGPVVVAAADELAEQLR